MAFTGTATVKLVGDNIARITGLSLGAGASGTIGFTGGAGQVTLPAQMEVGPYVAAGSTVTLSDAVDITHKLADTLSQNGASVAITKTGSGKTDFLATLTNNSLGSASGNLEIYVKFHS